MARSAPRRSSSCASQPKSASGRPGRSRTCADSTPRSGDCAAARQVDLTDGASLRGEGPLRAQHARTGVAATKHSGPGKAIPAQRATSSASSTSAASVGRLQSTHAPSTLTRACSATPTPSSSTSSASSALQSQQIEGEATRWRLFLCGATPREVLARIVRDDPLRLRARIGARLVARCLLVDADRVLLRAMARIARAAGRYQGRPDLVQWLDGHIDLALQDCRPSSSRLLPEHSLSHGAFAALARPLGLDPAQLALACARFNELDDEARRAFFQLVLRRPAEACRVAADTAGSDTAGSDMTGSHMTGSHMTGRESGAATGAASIDAASLAGLRRALEPFLALTAPQVADVERRAPAAAPAQSPSKREVRHAR